MLNRIVKDLNLTVNTFKDKDIKNVIAIGDEIKNINRLIPELHLTDTMSYEQILYIYKKIK